MANYDNVVELDFDDYDDDLLEDDFDDFEDDLFSEEDDFEDIERRRRRRRPRRRSSSRAKGGGYMQRQLKGYATKKELQAALARVGRDVRQNKAAVNANGNRISSLTTSTGTAIAGVRKEVNDTRQMFLLTSLLSGDRKVSVQSSGDPTKLPNGTAFTLKDESDSIDKLLPLLLMGGLGGDSGKGGMMENPLMLVLLLDAMK